MDKHEDLLPYLIIGAEGEDGDGGSNGDNSQDGADEPNEDSQDPQDDPSDDDHDDADDPNVRGLKSAVAKERTRNKTLERELRKANKALEAKALAEKSEIEQAQIRQQQAEERLEKLRTGYVRTTLDSAIREAARSENFLDIDDALAGVDRSAITVEQDDDDPAIVTIDNKSVVRAVKALAAKKPHFIKRGTDDGEPSGSRFGGTPPKKKTSEDTYREKYSGL